MPNRPGLRHIKRRTDLFYWLGRIYLRTSAYKLGSGNYFSVIPSKKRGLWIFGVIDMKILILQVENFTAKIQHTTYTGLNCNNSLRLPFVRKMCASGSIFQKTTTLYNRFPRGLFHDHCNCDFFKSMANSSLSYICS